MISKKTELKVNRPPAIKSRCNCSAFDTSHTNCHLTTDSPALVASDNEEKFPPLKWAQTTASVLVTIEVADC